MVSRLTSKKWMVFCSSLGPVQDGIVVVVLSFVGYPVDKRTSTLNHAGLENTTK